MNVDKTLYKLSKRGQLMMFRVYTQEFGIGHVLITEKGMVGGQLQEDIKVIEPKNVGRSNQTNTEDQAVSEASSKINKLKDKGYKDIEEPGGISSMEIRKKLMASEGTDASGNLLPMLAQKDTSKITFPGFLQRKYDGMRALIGYVDGELCVRSRNGKILSVVNHILDDLTDEWDGKGYLDGELYIHGRSLQNIVSLTKRWQPETELICFRLYDILLPGVPYKDRKNIATRVALNSGPSIVYVNTVKANDWSDINKYFSIWKAKGFEGAMWRNPEGLYEPGRRSYSLIKVKDFLEEEFEIVGVEEATGRNQGCAVFILQTEEGVRFKSNPIGTRELRQEYFNESDKYIGKWGTVRFQNWTPDGKPFHSRFITIRDYE